MRTVVIACACMLALAPRAMAEPDRAVQAKADALFEQGQREYQAGHYEPAIELFKQAYELVHDPVYLFNLGQSYRKNFDCEPAYDHYKRYLDAVPNAENRDKVEQWLRELQPCVDKRRDEAARRAAEEAKLHQQEAQVTRPPPQPPAPRTRVDRGKNLRLAGIAAGAVGVVGFGAGVVFSLRGASIKDDLAGRCAMSCNWDDPAIQKLDSDGRHANTLATVSYVGGGLALAAGATLYILGRARVEHVMVAPAEHGATVSAHLSF